MEEYGKIYIRIGDIMNLEAIITCNVISIILLLLLVINGRLLTKKRRVDDNYFFSMVIVTMLASSFELLSFVVDGKHFAGAVFLNHFFNTFIYLATLVYPVLWVLFVDWKLYKSYKNLKTVGTYSIIFPAILTVALLFNIKFNFLFEIDADNLYHRGPLFLVALGLPYVYSLASIIMVKRGKKASRYLFFPIWLFVAPIIIGGICQGLFYGISVFWCSLSIALVAVYMAEQDENTYIDALTGIYNRKYLTNRLFSYEANKKTCGGIMIDLDKFKNINDTFGHLEGDDALKSVGEILFKSIPKEGFVTRYAGDEFVVIIESADEKLVVDTISDIRENVNKFNSSEKKQYHLAFSMGHSMYSPGQMTLEEFMKEMDDEMYRIKQMKRLQKWKEEGRLI